MMLRFATLILLSIISVTVVNAGNETECQDACKSAVFRLPDTVVPMHYNLKLTPRMIPDNFTVHGEVTIELRVRSATFSIVLHQKYLTIEYNATYLTSTVGSYFRRPSSHFYSRETEMITLTFNDEVQPGNYSLFLKFSGILSNTKIGFYRTFHTQDQKKIWLAATHFEPIFARHSFPCMDEPALKATFDIAIKHHTNYTVLSNMLVQQHSPVNESDGAMWTTFQRTPRMPTYLVGYVLLSGYLNISNSDGNVTVWCRKDSASSAQLAHKVAQNALVEVQRYLNSSLPVPKLDHVALPEFLHGGVENWGLILFKEALIMYNETMHEKFAKEDNALSITHEIIHQWIGNVASSCWFTDVWVKEGLTTYLQYYITDKMFEDWNILDVFVRNVFQPALIADTVGNIPLKRKVWTPAEIRSTVSFINYSKAPCIFRMLAHCMTHETFRKGILLYLQRHKYDVASSDDFWADMQSAPDESRDHHENFLIKRFMDTWTEQSGIPVVTVRVNRENGTVIVSQEAFRNCESNRLNSTIDKLSERKWWVPINFATKSDPNFNNTTPSHWLNPEDDTLTLTNIDTNDWIIMNIQQTSFYMVNYDDTNWRMITEYLKSDDYTNIHPINRGQILYDAVFMLCSQRLDPVRFMELTEYLKHENHYIPWTTFTDCVRSAWVPFFEIKGMTEYIWTLFDNILENLGFEDRPDDDYLTQKTRHDLTIRDCFFSHPRCIDYAHERLLVLLENGEINRTPPYLLKWILRFGVQNVNQTSFRKLIHMYGKNVYSTFPVLGCVNDPSVIEMYLNLSLSEEFPLENLDHFLINSVTECGSEHVGVALEFVARNWQIILARIPDSAEFVSVLHSFIAVRLQHGSIDSPLARKLKDFLRSTSVNPAQSFELHKETRPTSGRKQAVLEAIEQWLKNRNF